MIKLFSKRECEKCKKLESEIVALKVELKRIKSRNQERRESGGVNDVSTKNGHEEKNSIQILTEPLQSTERQTYKSKAINEKGL